MRKIRKTYCSICDDYTPTAIIGDEYKGICTKCRAEKRIPKEDKKASLERLTLVLFIIIILLIISAAIWT